MDRYYSEWTDDVIAKMWEMEQICPPDCDEAKAFVTTFSNEDFTAQYLPKDLVGGMLEYYIGMVLDKCNFPYIRHPNGTQAFPDYSVGDDWIEVKSFDANSAPSFDIVSYDRLVRDLENGIEGMLYSDFIVLGYQYDSSTGSFYIESAVMYKIWQIVNYYIDNDGSRRVLTNTRGVIRPRSDLRPNDNSNQPSFADEYEFITALYKDVAETEGEHYAEQWLTNVQNRLLND